MENEWYAQNDKQSEQLRLISLTPTVQNNSKKQSSFETDKKLLAEDTGKYTQGCCQKKRGPTMCYFV